MCEYVRKADQLGADMKKYKKKSRRRGNLPHIPDEMRVAGGRLFEQLRRASLRAACRRRERSDSGTHAAPGHIRSRSGLRAEMGEFEVLFAHRRIAQQSRGPYASCHEHSD